MGIYCELYGMCFNLLPRFKLCHLIACIFATLIAVDAASLRPAVRLKFPHETDSNSPAEWIGPEFYMFNSAGHPYRSSGTNLFGLTDAQPVAFNNKINGGRWLEATWRNPDGILYGWYHNEPHGLCPGTTLTSPQIGAVRSTDNGAHWTDLGIILRARDGTSKCDAKNGYFAGGHGDFCVMLDSAGRYLYLFLTAYAGDLRELGVTMARMDWADREAPCGKLWKWHKGSWNSPGLGGDVSPVPVFVATVAWERPDCEAFWGPSVHWNTDLSNYVMLLNRAKGTGSIQEGIYVSYATNLANPESWSSPEKLLAGGAWYPQVVGLEQGTGTDKRAGAVARFFMGGISDYEIDFRAVELAIQRSGDTAVLSWSTSFTNLNLECSPNPAETSWCRVSQRPPVVNGEFRLTNDLSALTQSLFFRLERGGFQ